VKHLTDRRIHVVLGLMAIAVIGSALLYGGTIDYPLSYDDYHQVRPYTADELARTFLGNWDPSGIESRFYRPLTTTFYAARFEALGVNERAYRVVSITLFALAGALLGWCVYAMTRNAVSAVFASALFAVHPSMTYALVGWAANQMHLLAVFLVLFGVLWWLHVKDRSASWWSPLLVIQGLVFLVKEDGIMFAPLIVALHGAHRRARTGRWAFAPWGFLVPAVMLFCLMPIGRYAALGELGGYGLPRGGKMLANLAAGPAGVLLQVPASRAGQLTLRWLSIGAVVLGSLAAKGTRDRQVVPLAAAGLAVVGLFDAPLALAVKAEQLHFIATGSVLLITAGFTALYRASHRPPWRAVVVGAALVTLASSALVARSISRDFAPCAPRTLATNAIVRDWAAVPFEIRQELPTRPDACMNQPRTRMMDLPLIAFGAQGWEQDGLDAFRWTSRRAVLLVSPAREQVLLRARLRNPHVSSTVLRVRAGGAQWRSVPVTGAWTDLVVTRGTSKGHALDGMWRVELDTQDTWGPATVGPHSADRRMLGVQLGETRDVSRVGPSPR
jgi:hypothetical protein